jgi:hypothetical protein
MTMVPEEPLTARLKSFPMARGDRLFDAETEDLLDDEGARTKSRKSPGS